MRKTPVLLALFVASALILGCAQQQNQQTTTLETTTTLPAQTASVVMQGFAFNPPTLTIKTGTTVTWTNQDSAPHKISSDSFNSDTLSNGDSYSNKFDTPGTYNYICAIHTSMKGQIIVEA
jgi:plastocyanin